jgi:hypothetical protein
VKLILFVVFFISAFVCSMAFAAGGGVGDAPAIGFYGVLADEPVFDSKTQNFRARGNVAVLTSEGFLSGELMSSQDEGHLITIEGGVVVIRKQELVHCSRLVLDRRTGEFVMFDARIVSDPLMSPKQSLDAGLLGITPEEIAFESARLTRVSTLEKELRSMRDQYTRARNLESMSRKDPVFGEGSIEVQKRYAEGLRKLTLARHEPNQVFNELSVEMKTQYEARRSASRDFLASNPEFSQRFSAGSAISGYTSVRAERIFRNASGVLELSNASMTPCRCDGDTPPIFGLSARRSVVQVGGYAHLTGASVDVGSVPTLYSPYLIFPVKRARQSGFLRPYFYLSQQNRALGLPFFLVLGEHSDATFTLNDFAKRGTRTDLEWRSQLSPESRLELYGESLFDSRFKKASAVQQAKLDDKIAAIRNSAGFDSSDASDLEELESQRVEASGRRWYVRGSWNLPVTGWASTKVNGEAVSDPSYFSDFSTDDVSVPGLALLQPAQTSRRFLLQEAAVEYYGGNVAASGRVQGVHDIFSLQQTDTIYRVPRFELLLLPKRYFGLPISVEGLGVWERVRRTAVRPFVDLLRTTSSASDSLHKNGVRETDEPFVSGDRSHARATVVLPLPKNNFVSASANVSADGVEYRYPAAGEDKPFAASQSYFSYGADLSVPLFSEFQIFSMRERALQARLRHDFVPSMSFTHVPNVSRSLRFPFENQLFYMEDAVYSQRQLNFDLRSTWSLYREGFSQVAEPIRRIPVEIDPGVGTEELLDKAVLDLRLSPVYGDTARTALANREVSKNVFDRWAEKELFSYFSAVRQVEFGQNYVWLGQDNYRRTQQWAATPLALGFSTNYNLDAAKTELEKNERNNVPLSTTKPRVAPWGDLAFSAAWSVQPMIPVSASHSATWSVLWKRWIGHGSSVSLSLPKGITTTASRSDVITPTDVSSTVDRALGYTVAWQAKSWLAFSHAWAKQNKYVGGFVVRDAAYPDSEFDSTNVQSIVFSGLQDCMDITVKRQKDFKQRERAALWSVGLNMSFFGQRTGAIEVGQALNGALQRPN